MGVKLIDRTSLIYLGVNIPLQALRKAGVIITLTADKGSAIVIMNNDDYLQEENATAAGCC